MRQVEGWGDALRVWDGNALKFGCDDLCTKKKSLWDENLKGNDDVSNR